MQIPENPMTWKTTAEQNAIIEWKGNHLVVNAFAGTGKTSTLVNYAEANPESKMLYLAYNIPLHSINIDAQKTVIKKQTGTEFLRWLSEGLKSKRIDINQPDSRAHAVAGFRTYFIFTSEKAEQS